MNGLQATQRRRAPRRTGFTLIELLVVIAIIAILAAILFPVFAQARAKAQQAGCQSNLKQVGLAWHMYIEDYDGRTPGYTGGYCWAPKDPGWACLTLPLTPPPAWFPDPSKALLSPYMKNATMAKCTVAGSNVWNLPGIGAYGYNMTYLVWAGQKTPYNQITAGTSRVTLSMVGKPAETVAFMDYIDGVVYPPTPATPFGDARLRGYFGSRHNLGWNVLWVDGHVKWWKDPSEINQLAALWDLQ